MYRIGVKHHFSAAHRLVGYEGKCARLHGHSWTVEAVFAAGETGPDGLLLDFFDVRKALCEVTEPFDHSCLNEVEPFDSIPPTAENVARTVYERLLERVRGSSWPVDLESVTVWESAEARATYTAE